MNFFLLLKRKKPIRSLRFSKKASTKDEDAITKSNWCKKQMPPFRITNPKCRQITYHSIKAQMLSASVFHKQQIYTF
jgi:hypothetical protein